MKKLTTKNTRYSGHQDKMSLLRNIKSNPQVVAHQCYQDAIGGGGYITYQLLEEK